MKNPLLSIFNYFIRVLAIISAISTVTIARSAEDNIVCHYSYGGIEELLVTQPVLSPYDVPTLQIGSHLRWRIVFQKSVAYPSTIKIYTYSGLSNPPTLIHQATYYTERVRYINNGQYGFTGLNFVYEPITGSELQYWCSMANLTENAR